MGKSEAILCYISGAWAYFTTQSLSEQWGDDWNDAPYEQNAGAPYRYSEGDKKKGRQPWQIFKVAWEGPFETPCILPNSRFSVKMINAGAIAWLRTDQWCKNQIIIPAGTPLDRFVELIREAGGEVYIAFADCGIMTHGAKEKDEDGRTED